MMCLKLTEDKDAYAELLELRKLVNVTDQDEALI
jgi:hypothetical protein